MLKVGGGKRTERRGEEDEEENVEYLGDMMSNW